MKKTLIALMALAGVASAADYTYDATMSKDGYWADSYTFQFLIENKDLVADDTVLTFYCTNFNTSPLFANAFMFKVADNGDITLKVGRGKIVADAWDTTNSVPEARNDTDFTIDSTSGNSAIFSTSDTTPLTLNRGTIYTVTGVGTSQDVQTVTLTAADGTSSTITYNGRMNGTNVSSLTTAFNQNFAIPEPTTATLSLLALAGLAARRRRK